MANLYGNLKQLTQELRIEKVGVAPVKRLAKAPEDRNPVNYLPTVQSVISIGYRLNYAPIQNLPESRNAYMLEHEYMFGTLGGKRCGLCIKACPVELKATTCSS